MTLEKIRISKIMNRCWSNVIENMSENDVPLKVSLKFNSEIIEIVIIHSMIFERGYTLENIRHVIRQPRALRIMEQFKLQDPAILNLVRPCFKANN